MAFLYKDRLISLRYIELWLWNACVVLCRVLDEVEGKKKAGKVNRKACDMWSRGQGRGPRGKESSGRWASNFCWRVQIGEFQLGLTAMRHAGTGTGLLYLTAFHVHILSLFRTLLHNSPRVLVVAASFVFRY